MSKKKSGKLDLFATLKKGKELYDEYGDTVRSVVQTLRGRKVDHVTDNIAQIAPNAQNEVEPVERENPVLPEKVAPKVPTNIKEYRAEIETDDSFNETLATLEDAVSFVYTSGITNPQDVERALKILGEVAQETIKYAEEQETKREEIRAMRDAAVARINEMSRCVHTYLEKTFDERALIFAKQFEAVDMALKNGDNEMLALGLNNINSLAASSPFKNLADINAVQQSLISANTEWDV